MIWYLWSLDSSKLLATVAVFAAVAVILQTTVIFIVLLMVAVKLGMNKANYLSSQNTDNVYCSHYYELAGQEEEIPGHSLAVKWKQMNNPEQFVCTLQHF